MKSYFQFFIISISLILFFSCRKDSFLSDKSAKLTFSTDTVLFDTVFTTIGTTTQNFKVYNPYNKTIKISSIVLAKGTSSNFRINVDGEPGYVFADVIIEPKDSIFIFVEANIDPNDQNSPLVVQDSIVFDFNDNSQDIDMVAWGQDVHLINKEIIQSQTWINDKPYLVYNSMMVDTLQTLTIENGVNVYFHSNSSLYVKGSLIVNGTLENPVTFQGDRLESFYDEIPGQWGHIHFLPGSQNNNINYAIIKNGIIGIQVDSFMSDLTPTLIIANSRIENMNAVALYGLGAIVVAYNCVFANCGQYVAALTIGKHYEFIHCTFANYWSYANRTTPVLAINNYYEDIYNVIQVRPISTIFGNCIIYGSNENELVFDCYPGTEEYFKNKFDYCLMKLASDFDISDTSTFIGIIKNKSPKFVSTSSDYDYQLDTLSPAKDVGKMEWANIIPVDLNGESRISDSGPDLGAYERIE